MASGLEHFSRRSVVIWGRCPHCGAPGPTIDSSNGATRLRWHCCLVRPADIGDTDRAATDRSAEMP